MDASREGGFLENIKPPRLEDAGLEDCALPPELIKEAFFKAASAVKSIVANSSGESGAGDRCVDDPWEDSTDIIVGITDGVTAPSGGCVTTKGSGLTEATADEVTVVGGESDAKEDKVLGPELPIVGEACVDGLLGLKIDEDNRGNLGKKLVGLKADVDEGSDEEDGPTLAEGFYAL